jgi:hypothetical protein
VRPGELSLEEQLIASTAVANYRRNQSMADKVVFSTNVPESDALKFANGKRVESRYNDYEVYYSLTDRRALDATPALDARITALGPAAGEVFTICKREIRDGNRKRIEWQVTPSERQEAPQEPAAAAVPAPAAATSRDRSPSRLLWPFLRREP